MTVNQMLLRLLPNATLSVSHPLMPIPTVMTGFSDDEGVLIHHPEALVHTLAVNSGVSPASHFHTLGGTKIGQTSVRSKGKLHFRAVGIASLITAHCNCTG